MHMVRHEWKSIYSHSYGPLSSPHFPACPPRQPCQQEHLEAIWQAESGNSSELEKSSLFKGCIFLSNLGSRSIYSHIGLCKTSGRKKWPMGFRNCGSQQSHWRKSVPNHRLRNQNCSASFNVFHIQIKEIQRTLLVDVCANRNTVAEQMVFVFAKAQHN